MANDEVLGPRKTMFVLVIVVGCFAVLWPRILSPLIVGHSREQLKPNQFDRDAAVKQERPPIRMGPHPAMKERGRAIPPGAPAPPKPVVLPPHLRPPPIPGMRPPLGSPGGPVPAPKSSMGFVMPIYTICIIVFFVYTLSKILFKRTGAPYEPVAPDPQFRRRVFRDESRSSPDKLVVSAISGLVAEVQQQMESSYAQNQQRQDALDSTRPYTNGSIVLNSGPVQIITSEHQEPKEKTPEPQKTKESSSELKESDLVSSEFKEKVVGSINEQIDSIESKDITKEVLELDENVSDHIAEVEDEINNTLKEKFNEYADLKQHSEALLDTEKIKVTEDITEKQNDVDLSLKSMETNTADTLGKISEDLINEEKKKSDKEEQPKKSTPELLEEALKEDSPTPEDIIEDEKESSSVKVVGMEMTADGGMWPHLVPATPAPQRPHEAEEVKSIFLETDIPQQSRVLVSDFAEDRAESPKPAKIAPLVVSGKITLSLIQDAPRDTPERDPESTVDDFTTASAFTQHAEKQDDLSDEEIEEVEEIEVEEIEEEIEEEEEVEEDEEEEDIDVKRQK